MCGWCGLCQTSVLIFCFSLCSIHASSKQTLLYLCQNSSLLSADPQNAPPLVPTSMSHARKHGIHKQRIQPSDAALLNLLLAVAVCSSARTWLRMCFSCVFACDAHVTLGPFASSIREISCWQPERRSVPGPLTVLCLLGRWNVPECGARTGGEVPGRESHPRHKPPPQPSFTPLSH